jgi:glyoxylase-like metal-dependent hydrolase (beta-lactamase superfamily II)
MRISLAGGASHVTIPDALGARDGEVLDIPGRPKVLHTPGHTSGHICLEVGDVLITGDALITDHAISAHDGPQVIAPVFHHDSDGAMKSLSRIAAVNASVIVPGHGPVWHGSPAEAVRLAEAAR